MRDALSILERCTQDGVNQIDEEKIKELVGIPKLEFVNGIVQAIVEYNIDKAMEVITAILDDGKDISNLLWEMIKYIKDILMVKTNQRLTIYNENDFSRLKELAEKTTKSKAIRLISELSLLDTKMKASTQRTIVFEAGIIKLCDNENNNNLDEGENKFNSGNLNQDIYTRLDKIENYLRNTSGKTRVQTNFANKTTESKQITNTIKTDNSKQSHNWKDIVNHLKQDGKIVLYTNLINTNAVEINDMTIGIQFPGGITSFGKTVLEKPENKQELVKQVSIALSKNNAKII